MISESHKSKIRIAKFAAATVIYAGFALYLYRPHFTKFDGLQFLSVLSLCLAALGCFVLSRRWVASFWGSFFAAALYGFGPFTLGLVGFHPTVSLLAASIPWLFCPAALGPKTKLRLKAALLSALPFLAIMLFFQIAAYYRLFPIPIHAKLNLVGLAGLLAPLVAVGKTNLLVSFYHVPIAGLLMGISILLAARRFGIMLILTVAVILASCGPFLNVSPIMWLTIPVLCCSVLIGTGIQGLASAGYSDRKWLLLTALVMLVLALAGLLLATKYYDIFAGLGSQYARLLVQTAKMHLLGAIAVSVIFFMARAKLRATALRWAILGCAMAVDIFLGARFIVDTIH